MSGRTLVWLRHGRTAWNAGGRFQGQLDPPLDEVGVAQAQAAGDALAVRAPALVVASDLVRAAATGEVVAAAAGAPLRLDPRLREVDLGAWQGLTRPEIRERFPDEWESWQSGRDGRRGGGETYDEVAQRAVAATSDVLSELVDGACAVLVAHGGTLRAGLGALLDLPPDVWWRLGPLGNCRWSVTVEADRGWRLAEHGSGVVEPTPARRTLAEA